MNFQIVLVGQIRYNLDSLMDGLPQAEGWQALNNISSFIQSAEKRKQLKVFGQLDARLDYCEFLICRQSNKNDYQRLKSKKRKKELNEDLANALKILAIDELIQYYNTIIKQIMDLSLNICSPPLIENKSFIICEAYSRTYSLKMWKKKKLRLDRENHIIYAEKDKKIKIYDLSNYLIRRSENGDYFVLALEAINDVPLQKNKSPHFGFQYKNTYILWFTSIQRSIEYKLWQSIAVSLHKEQLVRSHKQGTTRIEKQKDWERLNKTQVSQKSQEEDQLEAVRSAIHIPLPNVQQQPEDANAEVKSVMDEHIKQNFGESMHKSSLKSSDALHFQQIIKQSFVFKLLHLPNAFPSFEDLHFQLQIQDESLKQSKRQVSFAKALLNQYNINTIDFEDVRNFDILQLSCLSHEKKKREAQIFQDKNMHNHFRVIYSIKFPQHLCLAEVLAYFLDVDYYKKINRNLSNCLIKAVIYSQNSTINYEQHHPYNRLFRPRQFFYVRHLTRHTQTQYFIIDRSISNSLPLPTSSCFVRGDLQTIYKISKEEGQLKIFIDTKIKNGSQLADIQNINMCQKYVLGLFQGLQQLFSKQVSNSKALRYYNLESHWKHFQLSESQQTPENDSWVENEKGFFIEGSSEVQAFTTPAKAKFQKKSHKASFYRIPRSTIVQSNPFTQSLLIEGESEELVLPQLRKTYSPPRKTYIQNQTSKASPETKNEQHDWSMLIQPNLNHQIMLDQKNGGFVMKPNPTMREKELLKKIIQSVAKRCLLGKEMERIGLPVDILAPQSRLERLMGCFVSAPALLGSIAHLQLMQKFKRAIVFAIQVSTLFIHSEAPFDSFLGETYQCKISDHCDGYAQQIDVSPNASAIYLVGQDYCIWGVVKQKIKVGMNSVRWENEGVYKVQFNGGSENVCFTTPPVILNGLIFSEREFLLAGQCKKSKYLAYYWMENQRILVVLHFEAKNSFSRPEDAKKDHFQGEIYEVSPGFMKQFILSHKQPSEGDITKKIGKISGRWTKYITIQNETVDFSEIALSQIFNSSNPLPSDSSFRPDIQQLRNNNLQEAQMIRDLLQECQRRDESVRLEHSPY